MKFWLPIITGTVSAFLVDLKEWYDWRQRKPGTPYDYQLAGARVLIGFFTGLLGALGLSQVG